MDGFVLLLLGIAGLLFYFAPAFVGKDKKNFTSIFVLNLLLGWTFIGWVIALVWAYKNDD